MPFSSLCSSPSALFVDVRNAEVRNGYFDLVDEVHARRVFREQADKDTCIVKDDM